MTTLRFKTNLKCGGCIRAITPGLESLNIIDSWNVDLESPDKTLEIVTPEDISDQVMDSVKKAGYQISRLS
jgi:copper chaperone